MKNVPGFESFLPHERSPEHAPAGKSGPPPHILRTARDNPNLSRRISQSLLPWRPAGTLPGRLKCCPRSEEHTSELQSLMRISYAVFCLKKKHLNTQTSQSVNHAHN